MKRTVSTGKITGMSHLTLMKEAQIVSKMLKFYSAMTQLIAQEDFILFNHYESFKSYIIMKMSSICNDERRY
jgi:hypothetical protein